MTRARGATLIEVMVSSAIILAMTTLVLGFMQAGIKDSKNSQGVISTQEQAYMAMHAMVQALSNSDIHSVRLSPPGVAGGYVCCLSAINSSGVLQYDTPGNNTLGHLTWQRYIVFYQTPAEETIRVGFVPINPPTSQPVPYRLNIFTPQQTDQVVATNVLSLAVTSPDGIIEPWNNPLTVTIVCHTPMTLQNLGMNVTLTSSILMDDSATTGQGAPLNDTFFNVLPTP